MLAYLHHNASIPAPAAAGSPPALAFSPLTSLMDQGPLPLSVAIVVKNGAATIGRTLASVKGLASEIVAVDSGSTDGTLDLLASAGAQIVSEPWQGFMRTKNRALELCTQPWVLCLDADESPQPPLLESIRRALTRDDPAIDGYLLNRKVCYNGRFLNFAWQPEWRLFLVRRGKALWTGVDPHTHMALLPGAGRAERLSGDLRHDSFGSFADQFAKQVGYAKVMAPELAAKGRGPGAYWRLLTSPPGAMMKQLILKQAWRDGWPGWLAAAATAQQALMKHALIIEHARRSDQPAPPTTAAQ